MDQPPRPNRQPPANRHYILDENGKPRAATASEWADWFQDTHRGKQVRGTEVGPYFVSTVFIGLNVFPGVAKPGLYETVVTHDRRPATPVVRWRYASLLDALDGHRRAVRWARIRRLWHWW